MFSIDIDYLFLNFLLLVVFVIRGKNISNGGNYWKNAIICIFIYVFVLGSRYGRGNDYFHYIDIYKSGLSFEQPFFHWINESLKGIGVGPHYFFAYYALLFIICAFVFLKPFKKYLGFILPLFLMATLKLEEYQIRQALGFSFVFLFIYRLTIYKTRKLRTLYQSWVNYVLLIVYALIATSIHTANAIIILIVVVTFFVIRRTIPLWISISAYMLAAYVISSYEDLSFLDSVVQFLGEQNSRFAEYASDSEKWFSAEGYQDKYSRHFLIKIYETLGNLSLFYLSARVIREKCNKVWSICLTNLYVIGTIFRQAFMNLELLNRMGGNLMLFWFVPLSLIIYYRTEMHYNVIDKICLFLLSFWSYDYLRLMFMRGNMTLFLWDVDNYDIYEYLNTV